MAARVRRVWEEQRYSCEMWGWRRRAGVGSGGAVVAHTYGAREE